MNAASGSWRRCRRAPGRSGATSASITRHRPLRCRSRTGRYVPTTRMSSTLVSEAARSLRAAVERLRDLRAQFGPTQVFGADCDPAAFEHAGTLVALGARTSQFRRGDFLGMRPQDFPRRFDAVLGNPPYVRHHALGVTRHAAARKVVLEGGWHLPDQASYWAYFVLHAIQFVAPGGRLGLVLPGALMHADYASAVRDVICRSFQKVTVLLLEGRVFPTAKEESVLVLAEGRGNHVAEVRVGSAAWEHFCADPTYLDSITEVLPPSSIQRPWLRALVPPATLQLYDALAQRMPTLADTATIRIGIVTGANHFFVLAESEARRMRIPLRATTPTLTRAAHLKGLVFSAVDVDELRSTDGRHLLVRVQAGRGYEAGWSRAYLRRGARAGVNTRAKCLGRRSWYEVPIQGPGDAFLLYMSRAGPRVVLNKAEVQCTNTIHTLTWAASYGEPKRPLSPLQC